MRHLFRWGLRLFLGLLGLAALGLLLVYYLATRSIPDYDDRLSLQGVSAPLEIVRDTAGVPHIFGASDRDVFFGLGFVHAQDRLWQMTMMRRTAQGRLSELFGTRTVPVDDLLRRLDLAGAAERSLAHQSPEARAALSAYAAGVNAWIDQINSRALGRGAPEFFLFTPDVAPWRPADSLAVLKLMGLQLSGHLAEEVLRAQITLALSDDPERIRDILPESPGAVAMLEDFAALFPGGPQPASGLRLVEAPFSPLAPRGFAGASNAWAATGERSTSGRPILANDPHLELTAPAIWYLAHLGLPSGAAMGGTIPGVPVVLAGRNPQLAWGVTSAYLDDQDLYIEELAPGDPNRYRTPNGTAPFRSESSILQIKDAAPQTLTLRWTENGPVLPGGVYDLASVTPPGHVMSLAWTVLSPQDTTFSGALGLMGARNVSDAMDLAGEITGPAQVLTLADGERIGMVVTGALPARHPRHESQGRLPSRGWVRENRWLGTLPESARPRFGPTASGIVGHTNNQMIDRPFPEHISFSWGDTQRVRRWQRLMQLREVHTRDSFIEAQLDMVSVSARTLLPLVAANLWYNDAAAPEGSPARRRRQALEMLADWNGEMNEHRPEPLIYMAWMRQLQQRLIRDDLGGALAADLAAVEPLFLERVYRNVEGAAAWCDIAQSARVENCTDLARDALDDALLWIDETYGGALESLSWGSAHMATHDHPVLGEVRGLGWLVNIRQSTGGGDQTLLRGKTGGPDWAPFRNVHAAGYRGVYDMADPDASVFIAATGASGHPLSRFYDNLADLWRRGEYLPMSLDPDLARAGAVGITWITPPEGE